MLAGCATAADPASAAGSSEWMTSAGSAAPPAAEVPPEFELAGRYEVELQRLGQSQSLGFVFGDGFYQRTTRGEVTESGQWHVVSRSAQRWELVLTPELADSTGEVVVLRPLGVDSFEVAGAPGVVFRFVGSELVAADGSAGPAGETEDSIGLDPERMIAGSGAADATLTEESAATQAPEPTLLEPPPSAPRPAEGGTMRLDGPGGDP